MRAGFTVLNQEILSQQAIKGRSCLIVRGIVADLFWRWSWFRHVRSPRSDHPPSERISRSARRFPDGKSARDRDMRPGERILYLGEAAICGLAGAARKVGLPVLRPNPRSPSANP